MDSLSEDQTLCLIFPPAISTMKLHFMENLSCRVATVQIPSLSRRENLATRARKPRAARAKTSRIPQILFHHDLLQRPPIIIFYYLYP